MKKFVAGLFVGAFLMTSFSALASDIFDVSVNDELNIVMDGETVSTSQGMLLINGSTYVPLRAFFEEVLGKNVAWDGDTSTIYVTSDFEIMPTRVTEEEIDPGGESTVKTKDDVQFNIAHNELISTDHDDINVLQMDVINTRISRLTNEIETFKYFVQLADQTQDESKFKPYIVEAYRDEIERMESVLTYWENLKEEKRALIEQQRQTESNEAAE